MSQHQAPYLHVVRSDAFASSTDTQASPKRAQEVEADGIPFAPLVTTASTSTPPYVDSEPIREAESMPSPSSAASTAPLAQAVMYAVVSWLALCVERVAVAVDIQPIAERLYEVTAHFDSERQQGIILRVRLDLEPGLIVRTTVEPVRP